MSINEINPKGSNAMPLEDYSGKKPVKCKVCGKETYIFNLRLCNRCWEITQSVENDTEIVKKILYDYMVKGIVVNSFLSNWNTGPDITNKNFEEKIKEYPGTKKIAELLVKNNFKDVWDGKYYE